MLAFEVSLNGERLYLAGIHEWRCLSTRIEAIMMHQLRDPLRLITSVPRSADGPPNMLHWGTQALKVGDTITVKIIDSDDVDEPFEGASPGVSIASFPP